MLRCRRQRSMPRQRRAAIMAAIGRLSPQSRGASIYPCPAALARPCAPTHCARKPWSAARSPSPPPGQLAARRASRAAHRRSSQAHGPGGPEESLLFDATGRSSSCGDRSSNHAGNSGRPRALLRPSGLQQLEDGPAGRRPAGRNGGLLALDPQQRAGVWRQPAGGAAAGHRRRLRRRLGSAGAGLCSRAHLPATLRCAACASLLCNRPHGRRHRCPLARHPGRPNATAALPRPAVRVAAAAAALATGSQRRNGAQPRATC